MKKSRKNIMSCRYCASHSDGTLLIHSHGKHKEEEKKEQIGVTSTGTPAEDREEEGEGEKREGNNQVIRIWDYT